MKRGTQPQVAPTGDGTPTPQSNASAKKPRAPRKPREAKSNEAPIAEELVTLPKSQFEALMAQMEERILKKVSTKSNAVGAELLETMRDATYSGSSREGLRPMGLDDFDTDDVLPEPVMFFTYSIGYMVMDDVKQGHAIRTPYNRPFKFTHLFRYERIGSRDKKEFMMVSVCKVSSKKELEWLQRHSLYGVKFFEDIRNVRSIDVEMQERLVEASGEISRLNDHEIVQRALGEGIAASTDINKMKRSLIQAIAQKRIQEKSNRIQSTYDRMQKEAATAGINIGIGG